MNHSLSIRCLSCGLAALTALSSCGVGEPDSPSDPVFHASRSPSPHGAAAYSGPLTIDRAVRLALDHNPELQAGKARQEAAAGRATQLRSWTNPELEVYADDIPTHRGGFSQAKNMAGINQVVPFPGKKKADGRIGDTSVAAEVAEWRLNRAELARDVKIACYKVLIAERSAAVTTNLANVAETAATAAAKRNAAGETTQQEQLRAEIELEKARAEKIEADREAATARQTLAQMLGLPEIAAAQLSGAPDESVDLSLTRVDPASIMIGHPAMAAARARRDQAAATLQRAALESKPDVTVNVAAGRDEAADETLMALRLSIPLPITGGNRGKQQEASARVREADAQLAATRQGLLAAWRTAVARHRAAAEQVTAYRDRILPKAEEALRLVQTGFDEGKFGFIDLLDVQRTTAETRLTYQKKLLELNTARVELEAMARPVPADQS